MALHADLIGEQRRIVHLFYHYLIEQYYSTAHLNRRIANLCWSKDPRKKKNSFDQTERGPGMVQVSHGIIY